MNGTDRDLVILRGTLGRTPWQPRQVANWVQQGQSQCGRHIGPADLRLGPALRNDVIRFDNATQLRGYCQPALRAASSIEASMLLKFLLSIVSITGPVSRPTGPPLGTYS